MCIRDSKQTNSGKNITSLAEVIISNVSKKWSGRVTFLLHSVVFVHVDICRSGVLVLSPSNIVSLQSQQTVANHAVASS